MGKYITITIVAFFVCLSTQAQIVVKWDELNKDWFMNSAGYPAEEPGLDSLYYRLHDFKLMLKADSSYSMSFSKDSMETGKYRIDRKKKELILTPTGKGKELAYSVAELTPDILTLIIGEKYTWAYYLSLTSHQ
jgi:hypothetical protein